MDKAFLVAFSITLLAGLSTVFGSFIVLFSKSKKTSWLSFSMSFAAGVMLYISFVEIIPDSIHVFNIQTTNFFTSNAYINFALFFLTGSGLAFLLEKVLPDHKISEKISSGISTKRRIYRTGVLIAISLAIHNFPEGIITFMECYTNLISGLALALAIALHNIPEGMSISVPILHATGSKKKAILYTALSGITEPIGALFCYMIIKDGIKPFTEAAMMSAVGGIMVFISIFVLMPLSIQYKENRQPLFGFISGCTIIGLSIFLMNSL